MNSSDYFLGILFLISTTALVLAILAFTKKKGEKFNQQPSPWTPPPLPETTCSPACGKESCAACHEKEGQRNCAVCTDGNECYCWDSHGKEGCKIALKYNHGLWCGTKAPAGDPR